MQFAKIAFDGNFAPAENINPVLDSRRHGVVYAGNRIVIGNRECRKPEFSSFFYQHFRGVSAV
jgi:hypothetical protein